MSTKTPSPSGNDRQLLARLHAELAARAEGAGLLNLAYRTLASPFGPLLLVASETGLVRVAFARERHESVLAELADELSPRILHAPGRLDRAARQLEQYFAGRRRAFDLPLDLQLARGFRRAVLAELRRVPYGRTQSYAALAEAAGNARAVRAAASACSHNPLPLVIPCHRIVRSDGAVGEYLGGTPAKRALLALEAAG